MAELHETMYGRRFFEHDLPEIHRQIKRVADALEKRKYTEEQMLAAFSFGTEVEAGATTKTYEDFIKTQK